MQHESVKLDDIDAGPRDRVNTEHDLLSFKSPAGTGWDLSSLITGYEDTEGYNTSSVQKRWQELQTFNTTDTEVNIPNSGIRLTLLNVLPQEEMEKEYNL